MSVQRYNGGSFRFSNISESVEERAETEHAATASVRRAR